MSRLLLLVGQFVSVLVCHAAPDGFALARRWLVRGLILAGVGFGVPARAGQPWQEMDYGPFLAASIEAPQPRTNIACKGSAIRLGNAFGGTQNEAVVFDTDLLRYSAGWTGGFVALKGVVFDGEHWAYPQINGQQCFGNPVAPGWARQGDFTDPREFPYGPLPRDWAHWQGLYLHDQKVVLSYTVGTVKVLELPGLEVRDGLTAFTRHLEIGPAAEELTVQVAFDSERQGRFIERRDPARSGDARAAGSMVVLDPRAGPRGANGGPDTNTALVAHWRFDQTGGNVAEDESGQHPIRLTGHAWGPGRADGAVEFAGRGSGDVSVSLDFLTNDLTVAVWARPTGDGSLLSQTAPAGPWVPDGKALFIRNGRLCFDVGWVGAVESSQAVPVGQWTHLAMTWSHTDGRVTLYVNGATDGPRPLRPRAPVAGEVVRVGFTATNFPAAPYFQGALDDLRLYQRRLTDAEVAALAGVQAQPTVLAVAVNGAPEGARWLDADTGHVRLRLPPSTQTVRLKLMIAAMPEAELTRFVRLANDATPAPELEPLTRGGPSRWGQELTTRGVRGPDTGPYAVDTLTWPDDNPWHSWMRFGGFDFFGPEGGPRASDGEPWEAAICTWSGDVWLLRGLDAGLERLRWRRFATGLYQPLGLRIVENRIYVLGRDQITRLHDLNGDHEADFYENFNNDTLNTEHFHEFAMDLQTDAAGDFYYMKAGRHAREALHPQHGTLMRVSADGRSSESLANGFRAPNGLLVAPNGDFYSTDQEGYWMPANRLNWIRPGRFYGNNWSWLPDGKRQDQEPPIVWIHPSVDRSPSTMAWVTSDRWGPLGGRLLSLSYGVGRVFLVMTETRDDTMQGGITPLPLDFNTGIMRCRFHPRDGQFYVCGLFGWAGNKTQPGGFHRVRYTGRPLDLPGDLHVVTNGVVLEFLTPLDPASAGDPGNYNVQVWNYRWTENYGSPDFRRDGEKGRDRLAIEAVRLSRDGRRVFLELAGLGPVMQMHIQMNLRTASGSVVQTYVHNTVHWLDPRPGEALLGEPLEPVRTATATAPAEETPGLALRFIASTAPLEAAADARRARFVAVNVPAGTSPTPFLPPGPFTARWEGYVRAELGDTYAFRAWGNGRVEVRVNGAVAIPRSPATLDPPAHPPVALKGGLNRLEVTYESPATGDALLRLEWSASQIPWEPVPPGAFSHDAANAAGAAAKDGETRRLGRELFATRLCVRCHEPAEPFGEAATPELASLGPPLAKFTAGFKEAWFVRWLERPAALRPDTPMPAVLRGTPEQRAAQARDLAAYLAALADAAARTNLLAPLNDVAPSAGSDLYRAIGCVACHRLASEAPLDGDDRLPLGHVPGKWHAKALVDYLRAPAADHPWVRMPDFKLTAVEAEALAAFLVSQGDAPAPASLPTGDATRGERLAGELGCANCHSLEIKSAAPKPPSLAAVAAGDLTAGCLADDTARRGLAPDYGFDATGRAALRRFLERDLGSLRRTVRPEFAERQFSALRCNACHQRELGPDMWSRIEARDGAATPATNPYDEDEPADQTIHRLRPPLTQVGGKLRPEWTEAFIGGRIEYKPRPKLPARMPAYAVWARDLALGFAMSEGYETTGAVLGPPDTDLAAIGRALTQKGALGCVDCHEVGDQAALAGQDTATINFAHIPERLRKSYYDRYLFDPVRLLPGTMMPRFVDDQGRTGITTHYEGDAARQFEAIWHYMRTVQFAPPTPGRP